MRWCWPQRNCSRANETTSSARYGRPAYTSRRLDLLRSIWAGPCAVCCAWRKQKPDPGSILPALEKEARRIQDEDEAINRRMGEHGRDLMPADGQGRLDPLQHWSFGHLSFWHCTGRDPGGLGGRRAFPGLQHRNSPLVAGRAPHILGVFSSWVFRPRSSPIQAAGMLMLNGDISCVITGRRPHCRQRRYGQQDRHLRAGRAGSRKRDTVLHRCSHQYRRSGYLRRRRASGSKKGRSMKLRLLPACQLLPRGRLRTIRLLM